MTTPHQKKKYKTRPWRLPKDDKPIVEEPTKEEPPLKVTREDSIEDTKEETSE